MPLRYYFTVKRPRGKWLRQGEPRKVLTRHLSQALHELLTEAEELAKRRTPVDRGTARAAIYTKVTRGQLATVLLRGRLLGRANAPHLPYLEYGTKPHFPPIDAIRLWAQRKLHDASAAYPVARAISRRGTQAHHMFENAWKVVEPKARPALRLARDAAIVELKG